MEFLKFTNNASNYAGGGVAREAASGWTGRGGAQLQGEIFKSYDVAGRGRGTKRGVGERENAVEYKTNTQPGNRAFCNETKYKVT